MQQLTVVGLLVACFAIQQGFSEGILVGHPKELHAPIREYMSNPWSYFKDLLDKHHKIRQFLCSRCLYIVKRIDQSIETEELKKDAEKLCDIVIKKEELARYCRIVVEGTLSTIYEQLRKFELKPELCSHLHLCDTCHVSLSSDAVDSFVGNDTTINPALLLVNISELKTFLTQMSTGGKLNDN